MLKKIRNRLFSLSFAQKLTVILLLFSLVPMLGIQQLMMRLYERRMLDQASRSTLSVVRANNNMISSLLDGVENASNLMLLNEFYYDIFSRLDHLTVGDCLRYDRLLPSEMARDFSLQTDVYKACLYTDKWIFNTNSAVIPITGEGMRQAGFDQTAREAGGSPCWITGYDYGNAIGSGFLQEKGSYDYRYPLTMVREMDFQLHSLGTYQKLSGKAQKPILVVHILEKDVRKLYQGSTGFPESLCLIVNRRGAVVSSDNSRFPTGSVLPPLFSGQETSSSRISPAPEHSSEKKAPSGTEPQTGLSRLFDGPGYLTCRLDGRDFLLCYDPIENQGLTSLALVPRDILLKSTVSAIRQVQFFSVAMLVLCAFLVAFFLSRTITQPIQKLTRASVRVAGGDFSADTPVPRGGDFRLLTESFNHMEREISRLIVENYEISLREKESQLAALSMQINPHFLYNTLNTINLLAIRNDDEETSDLIVDLSEMLQYTFKSFAEKMPLSEEIGWVSNYLHIMARRYDNLFCTRMDIDENLMDALVPKLLLQPLVENAILHGFSHIREGGLLSITVCRRQEQILFLIQDNGQGMTKEQLANAMLLSHPGGHVGLSNVRHRLLLLYGENCRLTIESEPGEGTRVRILIPFENGESRSSP